jgi:hypothetical protein
MHTPKKTSSSSIISKSGHCVGPMQTTTPSSHPIALILFNQFWLTCEPQKQAEPRGTARDHDATRPLPRHAISGSAMPLPYLTATSGSPPDMVDVPTTQHSPCTTDAAREGAPLHVAGIWGHSVKHCTTAAVDAGMEDGAPPPHPTPHTHTQKPTTQTRQQPRVELLPPARTRVWSAKQSAQQQWSSAWLG